MHFQEYRLHTFPLTKRGLVIHLSNKVHYTYRGQDAQK
jgi:hypothetical protein